MINNNNDRRRTKKNVRPKKNNTLKRREKDLELALIRSYPKQACWDVWLPCNCAKNATTVTTGLIAIAYNVNIGNVIGFATRFGSTFVEYRIVRARINIQMFSSTNPGVLRVWWDEKSNATPTEVEAEERATGSLSCSATDKVLTSKWVCADPLDLQYQAIATTFTPVTFKFYTDNANFGSSIVATDYLEISGEFQFQFRGLQGV